MSHSHSMSFFLHSIFKIFCFFFFFWSVIGPVTVWVAARESRCRIQNTKECGTKETRKEHRKMWYKTKNPWKQNINPSWKVHPRTVNKKEGKPYTTNVSLKKSPWGSRQIEEPGRRRWREEPGGRPRAVPIGRLPEEPMEEGTRV